MEITLDIGYPSNLLYSDVSISVPDHGIISFVGDNGCGKSTLLKTLAGIINPMRGVVPSELLNMNFMVSNYISIPEEVKVKDIMLLLGNENCNYVKNKYGNIYQFVEKLERQTVKKLSSGEKKVVEIFSSLALHKKYLLLDEASNALDITNKQFLLDALISVSQKDIVVFYVSHNLNEIIKLNGEVYCFIPKFKTIKKIHIILPLIIISIGLVGIITGNAFNENLTSKVKMLNIFQAYTQFSFIFLGFVYIYLFTEDSIKGTDKYISQLGYSLAVQILFKSLILYAYTLIITTTFIIGYAISIHFTDLDYLILIVCSIAAALLFTITFACLMSIIFKKALDATAFQLVFFIIFDVLNIITFGLTNPCDANSLATVTVRYISGIPIAHKSLESIKLDFETFKWVYTITPSIVYSIIIIIIILVFLCGKRVGGIYVRKYKD